MKDKELIIIGSGPAGLKAGQMAQKLGIDYLILEKGDVAQAWQEIRPDMLMLSPCHPQRDWTSISTQFPIWKMPITRPFCYAYEFVEYLKAFCEKFDLNVSTHTAVNKLSNSEGHFIIKTAQHVYYSRIVLVATGFFGNPYIPGIPGMRGNPIVVHSHFYQSPDAFRNQRVAIIGAGNSGAEIALAICGYAQVYLITRDALQFFSKTKNLCHIRGISESLLLEMINMEIIRHIPHADIIRVEGNVIHLKDRSIETQRIICATGYRPVLNLLSDFHHDVDQETQFPLIKSTGESVQIPGLFFAGPLAYTGLRNLFIHGFIKAIPETIRVIQKRLQLQETIGARS